jgi:hypothetical protein
MQLRRWTGAQIAELRKGVAASVPVDDLAEQLGRTRRAVAGMARRLGLDKVSKCRRWSVREDGVLRRQRGRSIDDAEAALRPYGRNRKAVTARARALGVRLCDVRGQHRQAVTAVMRATPSELGIRTRIEWCPQCRAPVSNWQEHYERMGHRRPVAA